MTLISDSYFYLYNYGLGMSSGRMSSDRLFLLIVFFITKIQNKVTVRDRDVIDDHVPKNVKIWIKNANKIVNKIKK